MPGPQVGIVYYQSAERPAVQLWLFDEDGALIDFSTGYTFAFKLGSPGKPAVFTKTAGITGAAGSGTERGGGTPNVSINFSAGELAALVANSYTGQLTATTGGLDRVFQFGFRIAKVVT